MSELFREGEKIADVDEFFTDSSRATMPVKTVGSIEIEEYMPGQLNTKITIYASNFLDQPNFETHVARLETPSETVVYTFLPENIERSMKKESESHKIVGRVISEQRYEKEKEEVAVAFPTIEERLKELL